jgi:hypothetical protein
LNEEIEIESRYREDGSSKMVKRLREEIGKFHEMLTLERKLREETQTTMFRMIEDIHGKVIYELQREVKER